MASNTKEYNQKYYLEHRDELLKRNNTWNKNNRDRVMEAYRELEYGVTPAEYDFKLEAQNNRCIICGKKETVKRNGKIQSLSVDHNHKTKEIRDLLCSQCNAGLGAFKDNIEVLERAIKYLKRHNKHVLESKPRI